MGVTVDNVLRKNKEGMPSFSPEKYNGIDVKMVDKISQIVKYVTKYVTKMKELNFNKYGFYDPIKGKRTYTNPNAQAGQFTPTEIATFNSDTFKPDKASVADKARYSEFLNKKTKIMSDPDASLNDILEVTAGYDTLTGGQSQTLEKTLQTYDQYKELTDSVLKQAGKYGPIIGKLRNLNPYDNDAKALQAQLTALVPQMARGIFGEVGVLTDQDVARYTQILPNLQGTEKYNIAVMAMLNKAIANSIKNKLKVWAASKRDVS